MRTKQKRTKTGLRILQLFEKEHTLTAVEITGLLADVNKTTVYRNLHALVAEGILKEILFNKNVISYERNNCTASHLVCDTCNEIYPIEIDQPTLKKLITSSIPHDSHLKEGTIEVIIRVGKDSS